MTNIITKKEIMEEAERMLENLPIGKSMIFEVVKWRAPDTTLASFNELPKFKKYIKGIRNREIMNWSCKCGGRNPWEFVVVVDLHKGELQ